MRATSRSEPVYRITGAGTSLSDEQRGRARRYLWSMGVRTACFLAAVVAHGALRWVLVVAALVLPWVSVVSANIARGPDRDDPADHGDTPPTGRRSGPARHLRGSRRSSRRSSDCQSVTPAFSARYGRAPMAYIPADAAVPRLWRHAMPGGYPRGRPASHLPATCPASPREASPPGSCGPPPATSRGVRRSRQPVSRRWRTSAGPAAGTPGRRCRARAAWPSSDARTASASSASSAPARSGAAQVGLLAGEQAVADLAVGGQPDAVAGAAERAGDRGDDADPARAAVDQPGLGRRAASVLAGSGVERELGLEQREDLVGGDHLARSQPCWASSGICSMNRSS